MEKSFCKPLRLMFFILKKKTRFQTKFDVFQVYTRTGCFTERVFPRSIFCTNAAFIRIPMLKGRVIFWHLDFFVCEKCPNCGNTN